MFKIADLANGGIAILKDQPDFTRGKFDMGVLSFLRHQLAGGSRAPNDLSPFSHFQLDVVNERAGRNIAEGQGIPGPDIRCRACHHLLPNPQLRGGEDIPLLPVAIVKQSNPGGSVRIVFDGGDLRRDLPFVPFEVNHAIFSLVPSPPVPGGNPSVTVSPSRPFQRAKETSFRRRRRDFIKLRDGLRPFSRRGGSEFFDSHL